MGNCWELQLDRSSDGLKGMLTEFQMESLRAEHLVNPRGSNLEQNSLTVSRMGHCSGKNCC